MPLVSILVPTFNDGRHLMEALSSVAEQTLDDFEVIVSDDAGTDGSVDTAHKALAGDSRFRFLQNERNLGMTRNWNRALAEARGSWVAKLDGDDAWTPGTLEALFAACRSGGTRIAFCRTRYCDANLSELGPYKGESRLALQGIDPASLHVRRGAAWYPLCFDDLQLWHSNAFLVAAPVMAELTGWDERWGCASDTDLILRLLERDEPVVHVPHMGVLYRLRPGSVSDAYRANHWLVAETSALHQLSLHRHLARGGSLPGGLRRNWYRHWCNWRAAQARRSELGEAFALPGVYALEVPPPPCWVRVEGAARGALSRMRGRWRGES
jgi:glycosyltransferase involved in cell wall biosynthesis